MSLTAARGAGRPLVVLAIWVALGSTVVALRAAAGLDGSVCWFKRATSLPCPTCGSTRAVVALATGEWQLALRQSPFVVVALAAALSWSVLVRRRPSAGEVRAAWPIALGLLLLGWGWLIVDGR